MNQLVEDVVDVQVGKIPFTYNWLLILITLVTWMESNDYQGMDVKDIEVCKGARYQNLWWVREPGILMDYSIQFWIYCVSSPGNSSRLQLEDAW